MTLAQRIKMQEDAICNNGMEIIDLKSIDTGLRGNLTLYFLAVTP